MLFLGKFLLILIVSFFGHYSINIFPSRFLFFSPWYWRNEKKDQIFLNHKRHFQYANKSQVKPTLPMLQSQKSSSQIKVFLPFILYLPESQVLPTFCFWIFTIKCFCLSPVNKLLAQLLLPVSFLALISPFLCMSLSCFTIYCCPALIAANFFNHLYLLKVKKGTFEKRTFSYLILLGIKPILCQIL